MTDLSKMKEVADVHIYEGPKGNFDLWIDNCQYPDRTKQEVLDLIAKEI